MFDFVATIPQDLHPILSHLPIGCLLVSFVLSIAAWRRPHLQERSWLRLVIGGLATLPATISGLVAHVPYEETSVIAVIEPHQWLGIVGTAVTLAVLGWRWCSRRAGRDVGQTRLYLGVAIVGLVWLVVLGGTGGHLTYAYGLNGRGVNPLAP